MTKPPGHHRGYPHLETATRAPHRAAPTCQAVKLRRHQEQMRCADRGYITTRRESRFQSGRFDSRTPRSRVSSSITHCTQPTSWCRLRRRNGQVKLGRRRCGANAATLACSTPPVVARKNHSERHRHRRRWRGSEDVLGHGRSSSCRRQVGVAGTQPWTSFRSDPRRTNPFKF